ncbi:hypothetical protein UPYG_G00297380 [Umbra pygmaea]|uniref:Rab effector MyRIP/Melanophilin domain-containing protein n=1 Tax=Umbra pygmaea TaxID=75934 RepID=A0ABD0WA30_UMBPY
MDGEIREELEVEEELTNTEKEQREEYTNNIQDGETGLRLVKEVDDVVLDKMLMLEKLSDTPGPLEETGPGGRDGGKDGEIEERIDTWDQTVDRVEQAGERVREKEEQTQTETSPQNLPQSLNDRDEHESELTENKRAEEVEEDSSKIVERGGYEGGEGGTQRSEVREVLWEVKESFEESRDDEENNETQDQRPKKTEESATCVQEEILSSLEIQNRYSVVSLRSITTEVLKVLNATEDILQGVEGGDYNAVPSTTPTLPPNTDPKRMDEELSRLEENVYVAASAAYGLEAELGDLEECARAVGGATSDLELSYLEEQVASAAAQVHQSDLQVSDIAARITALKNAGLNVVPRTASPSLRKSPR